MAILKRSYLLSGITLYVLINVISYTDTNYSGELSLKITLSLVSFVLLMIDYACIIYTKKIFNRDFEDFATFMKITLYLGVIVIPLISLYTH